MTDIRPGTQLPDGRRVLDTWKTAAGIWIAFLSDGSTPTFEAVRKLMK